MVLESFVVVHQDGKRAACAPPTPGASFEWLEFTPNSIPKRLLSWRTTGGAVSFATMNGGKAKPISELLEAA